MTGFAHNRLWFLVSCITLCLNACVSQQVEEQDYVTSRVNFSHLDHLSERVLVDDEYVRFVHIYSEAPDYHWVGDDDEGIACVDDAARASVLYLRHYELTGDEESRTKAEELVRFILRMQATNGLFYNFIWSSKLDINTEHQNSRADRLNWWTARAVWALGSAAHILRTVNPELSTRALSAVSRTLPHLEVLAARHGDTITENGRTFPTWLVYETASDATSELLLGLGAAARVTDAESERYERLIDVFAEGIEKMRFGSMAEAPFGAHASFITGWHGWGNSQSQALVSLGRVESARLEAIHFYPRLLVFGWLNALPFSGDPVEFGQIAYATRCVVVGLTSLYRATADDRFAVMAGLAASWFTGNNVARQPMYDPETGRGFDGINSPDDVNQNAGAESTIEALYSILEVEHVPDARRWMNAQAVEPIELELNGDQIAYRLFHVAETGIRAAVILNLSRETLVVLEGSDLDEWLQTVTNTP